jgi:ubiquinone/menaquinone biosynthesis C-methylase UbiE
MSDKTTHFGYREVPEEEKSSHVGRVFSSVATNYDRMNDLMSSACTGWQHFAIQMADGRPERHCGFRQ